MEAKKQAGRSPAACFAEWPLSDSAMRPTHSVTASPQAPDPSLRRQRQSSLLPLRLLFPTRTASLGSRGGLEGERATEAGRVRRSGGYGPTGPAKKCHFRTGGGRKPEILPRMQPQRDEILCAVFACFECENSFFVASASEKLDSISTEVNSKCLTQRFSARSRPSWPS